MKNGQKNKVAALDKVLGTCNALGASYTPSKASLKPTALKALLELAQEKQKAVIVTHSAHAVALNARAECFVDLPKLATRIVRLAQASGLSKKDKEELQMIKRRMFSTAKRNVDAQPGEPAGTVEEKPSRSSSKRDKLNMLESFELLIEVLSRLSAYNPVEPEFRVTALKARLEQCKAACDLVSTKSIALSNARMARNEIIFGPGGVVESTQQALDYIRGKFGHTSAVTSTAVMQASRF